MKYDVKICFLICNKSSMYVPGEDYSLGLQVGFQTLLNLIQKSIVFLKGLQQICIG